MFLLHLNRTFDKVLHDILVKKLNFISFKKSTNLIRAYLANAVLKIIIDMF